MPEVTAQPIAPPSAGAPPPAPPSAPPSAGSVLTPPPQVNTQPANWFNDFKDDGLKNYVQEKKFTNPEQMAERYKNLESLKGVPEERLLKLPEKMEGPEAKVIWEKLGTPKDVTGYEFQEKEIDPSLSGLKDVFLKSNLTKNQAQEVVRGYNEIITKTLTDQATARNNAILQADEKLKGEWGSEYEKNVVLAKQGAKVLGLDAKTLDVIEALQGRESLYKTLKTIGVGVGESNFVDGAGQPPTPLTPEQAQAELKNLSQDKKFAKKLFRGDNDARQRWDALNKAAAPGDKQIG